MHFDHPKQLLDHDGADLGSSDWMLIDQARINGFADDTDDHQWIHVDPERARSGPFGTTIAHGYLTLSLAPAMLAQVIDVDNVQAAVNYGLNKVRFTAPVPVGSRLRAGCRLARFERIDGGAQLTTVVTLEREGDSKPVCVAEWITRHFT